jgi:hypothetical protein
MPAPILLRLRIYLAVLGAASYIFNPGDIKRIELPATGAAGRMSRGTARVV